MNSGVHPQVKPAPTVMNRSAQMLHRTVFADIHRGQRGMTTPRLNAVIQFFKPAGGACDSHDVIVGGQKLSKRRAKTTGRAGHKGQF